MSERASVFISVVALAMIGPVVQKDVVAQDWWGVGIGTFLLLVNALIVTDSIVKVKP